MRPTLRNATTPTWLALALLLCLTSAAAPATAAEPPANDPMTPAPWPLTDALGRTAPLAGEANIPPPRADRFVGIFYFLWHDNRGGKRAGGDGPYDVSKILQADPDALHHPTSPLWGPVGMFHYWGEPLYGYYRADDPWVLRHHARLLADAGVDTLIFDTTNAVTYPEIYHALCQAFTDVRKDGGRTPRIAFMVNTEAGRTARRLYDDLYKPGRFRDLWFVWKGKPLLICDPKDASPELKAFFTLRRAHWPFQMVNTRDAWHWEAAYPQPYGYTSDPARPEQVNVSVAQNLRAADGQVTNMSAGDARGRSFHKGALDRSTGAVALGHNFQEQWTHAYALDPPFVMVTGWNEWIAGRYGRRNEPVVFVDQYSEEFSRDIEPMKGGHGDNYYCQLVAGVRRFKGVAPLPAASPPKTIALDGDFAQWIGVAPDFTDDRGDAPPRDHAGVAGTHYVNRTGRNDLVSMKVAHDESRVSFYARTRDPLTARTDPAWMWLLIDADRDPRTGWEGYDFIVNRTVDPDGTPWLEKNEGGWTWSKVAKVSLRAAGNELQLAVPRAALGLPPGHTSFDFKWADNLQHPGDVMDFYVSGDVAPEGRFKFRYAGQ
jgi:hypothetical protein